MLSLTLYCMIYSLKNFMNLLLLRCGGINCSIEVWFWVGLDTVLKKKPGVVLIFFKE